MHEPKAPYFPVVAFDCVPIQLELLLEHTNSERSPKSFPVMLCVMHDSDSSMQVHNLGSGEGGNVFSMECQPKTLK